jgi:hypothetical protein
VTGKSRASCRHSHRLTACSEPGTRGSR